MHAEYRPLYQCSFFNITEIFCTLLIIHIITLLYHNRHLHMCFYFMLFNMYWYV